LGVSHETLYAVTSSLAERDSDLTILSKRSYLKVLDLIFYIRLLGVQYFMRFLTAFISEGIDELVDGLGGANNLLS
jgi:hypothetical protein